MIYDDDDEEISLDACNKCSKFFTHNTFFWFYSTDRNYGLCTSWSSTKNKAAFSKKILYAFAFVELTRFFGVSGVSEIGLQQKSREQNARAFYPLLQDVIYDVPKTLITFIRKRIHYSFILM